jgi:hypothetical protein
LAISMPRPTSTRNSRLRTGFMVVLLWGVCACADGTAPRPAPSKDNAAALHDSIGDLITFHPRILGGMDPEADAVPHSCALPA